VSSRIGDDSLTDHESTERSPRHPSRLCTLLESVLRSPSGREANEPTASDNAVRCVIAAYLSESYATQN
jgi:hypothetical protein